MPDDYTMEMRAEHKPCPDCGQWHSSKSCATQYQYTYGQEHIPYNCWKCAFCGAVVFNGSYHQCPTPYISYNNYNNSDYLLREILEKLEKIEKNLEELEKSEARTKRKQYINRKRSRFAGKRSGNTSVY